MCRYRTEAERKIKELGHTLVCPYGCSAEGVICNGDPYINPCGLSIERNQNGEELAEYSVELDFNDFVEEEEVL